LGSNGPGAWSCLTTQVEMGLWGPVKGVTENHSVITPQRQEGWGFKTENGHHFSAYEVISLFHIMLALF